MTTTNSKKRGLLGLLLAGTLALTACGASNSGSGDSDSKDKGEASGESFEDKWGECDTAEGLKDVSDEKGTADDEEKITIGAFNGWAESFAVSYLMKDILEDEGYDVEIKNLDAGPLYTGLSRGDVDVVMDTWLPITHKSYLEKFGDKYDHLGCWYDNAKLTLAVNSDSKAQTIEDLEKYKSDYGNKIYGIEPGAGLMKAAKEEAIPDYDLSLNLVDSSTPAMLSELSRAEKANKDVAVTLWRPHWAYSKFDVRDLKDPKGSMGGAEYIHSFAHKGFEKSHPHAAQLFKNFIFDDKNLAPLEELMYDPAKADGDEKKFPEMVKDWRKDNEDFKDELFEGKLGS